MRLEDQPSAITPNQLLQETADRLRQAGVERSYWTAQQLMAHRMEISLMTLMVDPCLLDRKAPILSRQGQIHLRQDAANRALGMPLQYILRKAPFYGRDFEVGPGVFIPRPETEVLIETTLELIRGILRAQEGVQVEAADTHAHTHTRTHALTVLDVGTGSGAIAVTLGAEQPGLEIHAIECSEQAIHFARRNAARFHVPVHFQVGEFEAAPFPNNVELIAANLPYLDPGESVRWPRELRWEPRLALDGGQAGGTEYLKLLIDRAAEALTENGRLVLEIGEEQVKILHEIIAESSFKLERVVQDLNHRDRVVVLCKV